MNLREAGLAFGTACEGVAARIAAIDWAPVRADLDAQGAALIPGLLLPQACRELAALYPRDDVFRGRIAMVRHGFGRGEYRYFGYPLPRLVEWLRTALYPALVPVANRWHEAMGLPVRFPARHADFIARCHAAGQQRPTPLLLQYAPTTTTACTRTCTASMSSRCRWCCCCRHRAATSKAANSS